MTSFVLIPGACHGGWWYEPLARALTHDGHQVRAVTLAGLGPDGLAGAGQVNLTSHIAEATAAITGAGEPVVLVGHSYGGSVITAAADQVPEHVRALVYLDAFVPDDGDSCWTMTNDEQRRWYIEGAARTGLAVDPLPFFDPRARPHPLATLVQRSTLTGRWRTVPTKTYVAATRWPQGSTSPFTDITNKVATDPAWTTHRWATSHNVLSDGPERLRELLLAT